MGWTAVNDDGLHLKCLFGSHRQLHLDSPFFSMLPEVGGTAKHQKSRFPIQESGFYCLDGLQGDGRAEEFIMDLLIGHAECAQFADHFLHEWNRPADVDFTACIDHVF